MSVLNVVLPLGSSVLSFVFAAMVLDQWWQRRHSFQLVWGIGLLWYGISAGTEFLGGAFGWTEPVYRVWYLIGAFFVAGYLGVGTIYLLSRSRFGYFAGTTVFIGGLLSLLFSHSSRYPGAGTAGTVAFVIALVGAIAIIAATATRRQLAAHIAMGVLVIGSLAATYLVLTAHLPAPGWAVDPNTHVPVGSAFPGYVRVLTGPFNIAGALCLVFGAIYSAYVYMPKHKVLRAKVRMPVIAQLYGVAAVTVNFIASLPGAVGALLEGKLNSRVPATILIAIGAFIPGLTSGLNRFGVTWSFFLGEFLGLLLIFVGFMVSEEVFRNVRIGATLWSRRPSASLEREVG
ncbi:MAG: hypothetical protein AUI15_08115 [Actinobacteria bacterium 13_2_20CM_2_66_6]|nr:MAG: hypothetical protein AUI15_08115 [Actinobacteria bacterium 13_2_20CM_2_66_6]